MFKLVLEKAEEPEIKLPPLLWQKGRGIKEPLDEGEKGE